MKIYHSYIPEQVFRGLGLTFLHHSNCKFLNGLACGKPPANKRNKFLFHVSGEFSFSRQFPEEDSQDKNKWQAIELLGLTGARFWHSSGVYIRVINGQYCGSRNMYVFHRAILEEQGFEWLKDVVVTGDERT